MSDAASGHTLSGAAASRRITETDRAGLSPSFWRRLASRIGPKHGLKEIAVVRSLTPLLGFYPWGIPLIVIIGVLTSLAEGVGISLFIPFLKGLAGPAAGPAVGSGVIDSLSRVFDHVPPQKRFLLISACIFGAILAKSILTYTNTLLFRWLEARIRCRVQSQIFQQIQTVDCSFLDRSNLGKLVNVLSSETWRTGEALSALISLVISLCTTLVYLALLLVISWKLTLLVLAGIGLVSLGLKVLTVRAKRFGRQISRTNDALFKRMVEGVEGSRVIRAFGREAEEQQAFDQASEKVARIITKQQFLAGAVPPLYEVLAGALLLGIFFSSFQQPENLAAILVFAFVLYRLQPRIVAIESARMHIASRAASVKEVLELLDTSNKPYLPRGAKPCPPLRQAILLDRVSFAYPRAPLPALRDITVSIPAGKITAFVGPSGCGKTTLISLILRFYDPTEGRILVDGAPLTQIETASWRRRVALVSQDIYVFNTSVRQNIAYGIDDANDEEIIAAAKLADAHNFITQLPRGYRTVVGDRGVKLSGGQKQRITLARAILRRAEVLILDEATNAVDSASEQLIQRSLNTFAKGRTVILIAHRLATVLFADQIVVLERGKVIEQGGPRQLLLQNGVFAKLYRMGLDPGRSDAGSISHD